MRERDREITVEHLREKIGDARGKFRKPTVLLFAFIVKKYIKLSYL